MTEPLVALTDYLLALETGVFALLLLKKRNAGPLSSWTVLLFASLCVASLAGGTTHGFFLGTHSTGHAILWPVTLLAIGVTALSLAVLGALAGLSASTARRVSRFCGAVFLFYVVVVLFVLQEFVTAIAGYLPAVLFFLVVLIRIRRSTDAREALDGVIAVLLTLLASGVQQAPISIPGVPHANNVLYHLIEFVALVLLFRACLWLAGRRVLPLV